MQPDPTTTSRSLSLTNSVQTSHPAQHGFQLRSLPSPEPDRLAPWDPSSLSELGPGNSGASTTSFQTDSTLSPLNRAPSEVGDDGIVNSSEHNNPDFSDDLVTHKSRKQTEGPEFHVIKRKGAQQSRLPLDQFPNEVLTHILSHLPAASLSAMACVSRRFYSLVTTPHAWRIAFARFFPEKDAFDGSHPTLGGRYQSSQEPRHQLRSEQRFFTRLSLHATWRSEYILRTRLLRSLTRGKPAQSPKTHGHSSRSHGTGHSLSPVITYNSQLFSTINHIHAEWANGKKAPRFIHGTNETGTACTSDPTTGKIDNWGLSDPQALPQFSDLFPGDQPYGLGEGPTIGIPNVMDVSQPFGMIYGEGFPGGLAYFRSAEEMRGRFLTSSTDYCDAVLGIPKVPSLTEAICSVWIAKSSSIPTMTAGLVGIMTGSSCGTVSTYSLGVDNLRDTRLAKGEVTARWMLSPGVPIISIAVDDSFNSPRWASQRVWAVAVNALGEVFYLTEVPRRVTIDRGLKLDESSLIAMAWDTGRSATWHIVEATRRVARSDPYQLTDFDGSYSPRSSSKAMNLSKEQLIAETREIEKFISFSPATFRKMCEGWDMRRKLEVDFAGDDGHGAGESIMVVQCGVVDGQPAQIKKYARVKSEQGSLDEYPIPKTPPMVPKTATMASLFGGGKPQAGSPNPTHSSSRSSHSGLSSIPTSPNLVEEWRVTCLVWEKLQSLEITTTAIDRSTLALLTVDEDPLTADTEALNDPSSMKSQDVSQNLSMVPGQRACLLAIGTNVGSILVWNIRGSLPANSSIINEVEPLRLIWTDSPKVSCLALSALYLVHGGNDGLVQAWDPLASTLQPLRTLHSRFSSRARRRLVQAEASAQGVGINLFAAGAIIIDPDPTVLRGMVSLGTHLRFWSYSSSAADQLSSRKRRLRRSSERGSNAGPNRFSTTGRGAIMDYILSEQEELRKEKDWKAKEETRLRGRFGVGLNGLSDEEAIRYAEMLSQESFRQDEERRVSDSGYSPDPSGASSSAQSTWSSETVTPEGSVAVAVSPRYKTNEELDHDIEKAIRLSMMNDAEETQLSSPSASSSPYQIPFTNKEKKSKRSSPGSSPNSLQSGLKIDSSSRNDEFAIDDLDLALKLSLAEEQSRLETSTPDEEFPVLERPVIGKGKGRAV